MSPASEAAARALVEVYNAASVCEQCPLSETRTRVVFGAGNADADLMFVGEAPGAEEDRQGLPFVGRAGGLLNQLLEGIEMSREDVFIANVLKCRPPGNRDPQPDRDRVLRALPVRAGAADRAAGVCTLGNFATKLLTGSPTGITQGARHPAGARARRPHRLRPAALSPRRGPAHARGRRDPAHDFQRFPELLAQPLPQSEPQEQEPEPAGVAGASEAQDPEADQLGLLD